MPETLPSLRRKIKGASDLQSVVRTMKTMAAASIGPYERAVEALADYNRAVELALGALLRRMPGSLPTPSTKTAPKIGSIVVGTDQGMVGQFNEQLAEFAVQALPAESVVWAVGERMRARLEEAGLRVAAVLSTPSSVTAITPLVSELLLLVEREREEGRVDEVRVFHNQPRRRAGDDPAAKRLLPLDTEWRRGLEEESWPTRMAPEIILGDEDTLTAFVHEFLFVSIFRACAESLAAENARRFAAMQGAEKNIGELMTSLTLDYNHRRQSGIDEELFDLIAGYAALTASG